MAAERSLSKDLAKLVVEHTLAPTTPVTDQLLGAGISLSLGEGKTTRLDVFAEHGAVRLQTPTLRIELGKISSVMKHPETGALRFASEPEDDQSVTTLDIAADGSVTLSFSPDAGGMFSGTQQQMADEELNDAAVQEIAQRVDTTPEHERVTLRGRLGTPPRFRTTPKQHQLVAQFPLAVHDAEQNTTWYEIVAFGQRAQQLAEKKLTKGQEVEIVGYPHQRERRRRGEQPKQVTEIYATAIRTSLSKQPPAESSAPTDAS